MSETSRRVFLCHASEDKAYVRWVYDELVRAGFDAWLDEKNLLPGQNWEYEIPRALRASAAVIVFLSRTSVSKRGYVQREFRLAFDALQEIPQGQIFVIPVKLDDCDVPEMFRNLHWSRLGPGGRDLAPIISSLRHQLSRTSERSPSRAPVIVPSTVSLGRYDRLRMLEAEVQACTKCRLGTIRTRSSFARGSLTAAVMFLGEAPGATEELTGLPFTGAAGALLDKMISAIGLDSENVYLSDVIKCRAPGNRAPEPDELEACRVHWKRQIDLVTPRILVTLGSVASQEVLQTSAPIAKLRGRWAMYKAIPVMTIFHPAYLLRTPNAKRDAWNDLKAVRERLGGAG